jgi:hypothetical protein
MEQGAESKEQWAGSKRFGALSSWLPALCSKPRHESIATRRRRPVEMSPRRLAVANGPRFQLALNISIPMDRYRAVLRGDMT